MNFDVNSLVTVAIPNYNNKELLNNLLLSLKKSISLSQVIIVDNASQDGSVDLIKEKFPEINLIENNVNKGFACAVNQAIHLVETEYVFLLNNDTVIEKDTIPSLLETIQKSDDIFSVSSKMIQYYNKDLLDDVGDEYTLMGWSKRRGYGKNISEYPIDEEVFSACAGAALFRMNVFSEIGYFDENFESYVEDMDLSFRARLYGYKSYYSANAVVYHVGSAATGSRYNKFKVKISARNNIYLIYKNMPSWMKLLNGLFIIIGIFIKYLFFYRKGMGEDYLEGIKEGLSTKNKLVKTNSSLSNLLKIEYLLIKNTITFLK
ncbi:glycosyltransferase family 2 protein [Methanosphaera sp. ISO3-F5]|uniref:glycosyltransferase family 2 protein n=1 Tax=Methanosphaera sp. ISO3-F5 TaxID=1452353 RepID=UPI002B25AD93|nr:glycosyltransferase family 2 protein [Methanosphaera sp. ISO3-F5]WQH65119.1 glycosyltransferase family 2 protein [Methanosphaera sp. ISO3-F5]